MWANGAPHAWCKECGWSPSHSTKHHDAAMTEGSSFKIEAHGPRSPLAEAKKTQSGQGNPPPASNPGASTEGGGGSANTVSINKDKAKAALNNLESSATSAETIEVVTALRDLFSLN